MRITNLAASALAAIALTSPVTADSNGYLVTSISTYTHTITVELATDTVYATKSYPPAITSQVRVKAAVASGISPTASLAPIAHSNDTVPSMGSGTVTMSTPAGTGMLPSMTMEAPPDTTDNAATRIDFGMYGFAAVAGVVGLLAF